MNSQGKVKLFAETEFSFPYQIRVSKRAKRLNLKVSADKGVQLTITPSTSKKAALAFLAQHVAWVERNAHIWQQYQSVVCLPEEIILPVLEQQWQLQYEYNPMYKRNRLLQSANQLTYIGCEDNTVVISKLKDWLKRTARQYLTVRINQLSLHTNLPFAALSFRQQKTVWGSCSYQKNISLNSKLIFLPTALIDYVLVHELVHTQHLNHGKRFWAGVATHLPDYKIRVKQLRQADSFIPAWFAQS